MLFQYNTILYGERFYGFVLCLLSVSLTSDCVSLTSNQIVQCPHLCRCIIADSGLAVDKVTDGCWAWFTLDKEKYDIAWSPLTYNASHLADSFTSRSTITCAIAHQGSCEWQCAPACPSYKQVSMKYLYEYPSQTILNIPVLRSMWTVVFSLVTRSATLLSHVQSLLRTGY